MGKKKDKTLNTEVLVITDRSGSMSSIVNDVIGGYNTFIEEQKKIPGEARVTFVQFDDKYEEVYVGKPLQSVPTLNRDTFVPRGSTALLDAIGRTLNSQSLRIKNEGWAELVVVCIITDGEENASREYTAERVRTLTQEAEGKGWKFVYLGANQDAFKVTQHLGFRGAISANYSADSVGTKYAYGVMGQTMSCLRSGGSEEDLKAFVKKTDTTA